MTATSTTNTTTASGSAGFKSADAEARRKAMIAAAEARDKAHKSKTKTIKHVTKSTLEKEKQKQSQQETTASDEPLSELSRQAALEAKQSEAALANQLGYNPYETSKSSSGQARNATATTNHGNINAETAGNHLPTVAPPADPTTSVEDPVPEEFDELLATIVSSSNSNLSILSKLIVNATTKGQADDSEEASKFRKIKLSNPKIKSTIVDVDGAIDLMLLVGFQLHEDQEGESCLIYPPSCEGPAWLPRALTKLQKQMK
jgi:hypothetical protein